MDPMSLMMSSFRLVLMTSRGNAFCSANQGEPGLVANCLACSLIGVIHGMKLRVSGEPQKQNVQKLLGTTPEITQACQCPSLKVDRGYDGEHLLEDPLLAKFDTGAICNKASRNPFLSNRQIDEQKGKWKVDKKLKEHVEWHSGRYKLYSDLIRRCLEEVKD